jgi:hypothetical protein
MDPRTQYEIDQRVNPETLYASSQKSYRWLWVTCGIGAVVWGFNQLPASDPCKSKTMAAIMAQDYVKEHLKAPSTAVFPNLTDSGVSIDKVKECMFRIRGYVDAENSFGAMIRTTYIVDVEPGKKKGDWLLSNLRMSNPN